MPLDLTLSPLYRIRGQEASAFPGLVAVAPPRKTARGREQDYLAVQLVLTGNASFSVADYAALAALAGERFHQSSGPLTSALRAAADAVNESLLKRNISTSGRGQYAVGWLALLALRDSQCTILLSGPMHIFVLSDHYRHIFEPALSGRGLGVSKSSTRYFTQADLKPGDRLLVTGRLPGSWESALADSTPASLEATRRKLLSLTNEDLHATLMQVAAGTGSIAMLSAPVGSSRISEETLLQQTEAAPAPSFSPDNPPSAYAIPMQQPETPPPGESKSGPRMFPPSIPRLKPAAEQPAEARDELETQVPDAPREPSRVTRRAAKAAVGGIRAYRGGMQRMKDGLRRFLPRLFPGDDTGTTTPMPAYVLTLIATAVPLIVVTAAMVAYLRFGRSAQYENYLAQAQTARTQAVSLEDPVMQRDAWQSVLLYVDKAESYRRSTPETEAIRTEANARLDSLLGVIRLDFKPAFSSGLGGAQISRMAATENDLYLLDARTGEVLHAQLTGHGFQQDVTFSCKPGLYGGYQVGPLVDILAMPLLNSVKATVVGVDAGGNLLYCAPGQVAQAIPLPPPDTNWGRVTALTMDAGNLYVLDAPSRAVWVYVGKDGAFVDRPYFFFTEQIPEIQDGIDLAVKDDSLFLLHSDGHLSTCSYSRIETVPTRCQDPAPLINPFAAYKDRDLFGQANITQMMYTSPPDSTILLLGADSQSVLRLTPASLELQNQISPAAGRKNPLPAGTPIDAMTASPNHVLYLAVKDQVYFAQNMP